MEKKRFAMVMATIVILTLWITLIPGTPAVTASVVEDDDPEEEIAHWDIMGYIDSVYIARNHPEEIQTPVSEATPIKKDRFIRVKTTLYHPVPSQCMGDPRATAADYLTDTRMALLKEKKLRWIAVSRWLEVEFPMNTKVYLESGKHPEISGVYLVKDRLGPSADPYQIDILVHPENGYPFGNHYLKMYKVV